MSVGLVSAGTAQAAAYPLAAPTLAQPEPNGLQIAIGGGLPLPIQGAIPRTYVSTQTTPGCLDTMSPAGGDPPCPVGVRQFPPLLVPPLGGVSAPTGFILQPAGADPKDITIIYPLLEKPPVHLELGQVGQNPALYQVGTQVDIRFPAPSQTVMFQLGTAADPTSVGWGGRTGLTTDIFSTAMGNTVTYSNALGQRFGGPGQVFLGQPSGKLPGMLFSDVLATVWAIGAAGGSPPCKHPAFGGPNAACVAGLINAVAVGGGAPAAWGAEVGFTATSPGGTPGALVIIPGAKGTAKPNLGPEPGVLVVEADGMGSLLMSRFTMTPLSGTALTQPGSAGLNSALTGRTNMATSFGYPWTTGMITVVADALGAPETFTITGMDGRVDGVGVIQMVTASLGLRTVTGDNANRGWLQLNVPEPSAMLAAGGALAVLALCHGLARRRSR